MAAAGPGPARGSDPEALVRCPYDSSHRVRVSRLPYHMVKCRRNNPQAAHGLAVCPCNARHCLPPAELRSHLSACPDRDLLGLPQGVDLSLGHEMKQPQVPAARPCPPCREDWEAELEGLEEPPPFILRCGTEALRPSGASCAPAAPTGQDGGRGAAGQAAVGKEQQAPKRP
ncbi:gametocyte-specific factor 1 [Pogoniulus pusillus]|uniref:gametocyte-specific factor 1 n=1 Tax=Pogoniulus pusillus TaxID=488313 RepID=UPI0030B91D82